MWESLCLCLFLNFGVRRTMSFSKLKNFVDQSNEDQHHKLMEQLTELQSSFEELHLTSKQKELLSFFWHKQDQAVIEELSKQAIEYIYLINSKKLNRMEPKEKLRSVYASMYKTGMFEEHTISSVPDVLKLSKNGIKQVMSENPKYSQASLILFKLWENKLSFVFAIVGFAGSLFSIFGN